MNKTIIMAIVIAVLVLGLIINIVLFRHKQTKIKELEIEIGSLKTRIELAQGERDKEKKKYDGLIKSLADAKKRKQAIKAPKNEQETKERFNALGYKAK